MADDIPTIFDACEPRDDVRAGTLEEQQFAAKLASVAFNPDDAVSVYRRPEEFFESTYPTDGLKELLTNLVDRFLVATGDHEPTYRSTILCLDTTFGGGKTHDLIAAYHLAESGGSIDGLSEFLDDGGKLATAYRDAVGAGLRVRTGVLVGGFIDARNARSDRSNPNAPNTNTLWGELAYQLYGQEGYEHLKEYDRDRNAPGESELRELFKMSDDPVLVLIDEIAEYLEDASAVEIGETTLASQTVSFLKSLLEASASTSNVTVVYSIADDAFGEHAEVVQKQVKDLDAIEKRKQRPITPTGDHEVSAVLRNRLFESVDPQAAEQTARTYVTTYDRADRTLPSDTQSPEYRDRLKRHYPLHPTVIRTLTEKVDSIQDFQRTRGALKLVARAVHHLWKRREGEVDEPVRHNRHLLRLFDLTPADDAPSGSIRATLSSTLFDHVDLEAAVKADIYNSDGDAHAQREDDQWTEKGFPPLGTYLTTTTLWHSLAIGEQAVGLTRGELYESLAHPELSFGDYDDALKALTGTGSGSIDRACHYLYDEDRLKFKAEANLIRLIDQYTDDTQVAHARSRLKQRLRNEVGTSGGFETKLFPESPGDLPDRDDRPQVAVMRFETVAVRGEEVPELIEKLYEKTASEPGGRVDSRSHKNYVLFVAPDADQIDSALDQARRLEGMTELRDEAGRTADLSDRQLDELNERIDKTRGLFGQAVRNAYRHLYYPNHEGLVHTKIPAVDANGETSIVEAIDDTLGEERIRRGDDDPWSPFWFKEKLWQQTKNRMSTTDIARQFARKPGLDFLFSTRPLRETFVRLVNEADYAYWDGESETLYWDGDEPPENWEYEPQLAASEDVRTTLPLSNAEIDGNHYIYEDIDAVLDAHELAAPDVECAECGRTIDDPDGQPPYYCGECGEEHIECSRCGRRMSTPVEADPPVCSNCRSDSTKERWEFTTDKPTTAHTALTDVLDQAELRSGDGVGALSRVRLEVCGNSPLSHGDFLAAKLSPHADLVSAAMEYAAEGSAESTEFDLQFSGTLDDFRDLKLPPESFSADGSNRKVTLQFELLYTQPRPARDDDVLDDLIDVLEGTDVYLQVHAEGPVLDEQEVKV